MKDWISVSDRLPELLKNVLVTINYDEELHIAYLHKEGWKIWKDDELEVVGNGYIENLINDQDGFGVIAWQELPERAEWKPVP